MPSLPLLSQTLLSPQKPELFLKNKNKKQDSPHLTLSNGTGIKCQIWILPPPPWSRVLLSPLCSFCTVSDDFPALPPANQAVCRLSRHDFLHSDHPSLSCGSISLPLRLSQMAPCPKDCATLSEMAFLFTCYPLTQLWVSSEHFSLLDILYLYTHFK